MRTLRFFSFGPSCSCWTAPSYVVSSQRACTSAFATHAVVSGLRFRERAESRDSVAEVRSRIADVERSFVSSLRESSTTLYGGFAVPGGLVNCQRRLYSKVASKKGKKSEKDVLIENREPETEVSLEERGEDGVGEGEVGKLDGKKTKKKKKGKELLENGDAVSLDDDVANGLTEEDGVGEGEVGKLDGKKTKKKKKGKELLENGDAVSVDDDVAIALSEDVPDTKSLTNLKKEKKKKTKNNLKQEEPETDSEMVQNGASTAEAVQEIIIQSPAKRKKKLKNKSKRSESENVLSESDPESVVVIEDDLAKEFEEHLDDDDFWEDDFEPEAELNDGGDGGGVVFGGAPWTKSAFELAEKVVVEFNGALEIFAFKVSNDSSIIRIRVDKLSDKYGSPTMDEIQQFSSSYSKLLDKAGEEKTIPDNYALEVSSPGAERVVRLPQDLERFKDLPMYVRYIESSDDSVAGAPEKDGILELDSVDMEVGSAKWKLADVRLNRDLAGKGRGLTRKQRDWRIDLPFETTQLVRLYVDL